MAARKKVEAILKEDAKGNDQEVSPDALEKIQKRTRKSDPEWMSLEVSPEAREQIQRSALERKQIQRRRVRKSDPEWMIEGRIRSEAMANAKVADLQSELNKVAVLITNGWNGRLAKFLDGIS